MIIGLSGKKQVGKTTTADFIAEMFPGQVQDLSFAGKLKESFAALLGIPVEWLEILKTSTSLIEVDPDPRLPEEIYNTLVMLKLTFREGLQRYGTEAHRDIFGDSFWIDIAFGLANPRKIIVLPDVRFPNEVAAVKLRGGRLIMIKRPGAESDGHESEQDLPEEEFDVVIENDGTLADLRVAVEQTFSELIHV